MRSTSTGSSAWLVCKRIPEPHNQEIYDLFIGDAAVVRED